jgi:hypothetical protein
MTQPWLLLWLLSLRSDDGTARMGTVVDNADLEGVSPRRNGRLTLFAP